MIGQIIPYHHWAQIMKTLRKSRKCRSGSNVRSHFSEHNRGSLQAGNASQKEERVAACHPSNKACRIQEAAKASPLGARGRRKSMAYVEIPQ
jgi:hypothetical protein